ncbi:phosphatase PAP2 family protein [Maritalea mediterranea]|uniref:phosphatase PAP2 family protein n=1 Tax=Maritalea mediterranea TaxID=2909667 RepID=UPI001F32C5AD
MITGQGFTHSCDVRQVMIVALLKKSAFFSNLSQKAAPMVNIFTGPDLKRWSPITYLFILIFAPAIFFVTAMWIDAPVTNALTNWPPQIINFFELLTRLGESDWILIPTLLFWGVAPVSNLLPLGYRLQWRLRTFGAGCGFVFAAVALPGLVSALIKRGLGRARPVHMDELGTLHFSPQWGDWTFQSFPSGHTTTAFALATAIYLLTGRWGALAYIGAVLIALSRIVDGVHYFSDVVAGTFLGVGGALWVYHQYRKRKWGFDGHKKGHRLRWAVPYKI